MTGVNLEFPFAGRSDRLAYVKQRFLTTPNAANVRAKDPVTRRLRGAQRAGQRLLFVNALGGRTKIKDIASISVNNKKINYSAKSGNLTAATPEAPVWVAKTPSGATSADLDVDRQGNIYVIDGPNALVKYNSAGKEIWRTALPVEDKDHVARGVHVDQFDGIYVGISTGGDQSLAELWKYDQIEGDEVSIAWSITPGRYVETMERYGDLLYVLQNDPESAMSYVVIYDRIDTTAPVEVKSVRVPFPSHDLSVGDDGAFYVASPRDTSSSTVTSNASGYFYRGINPQHPTYLPPSEDWTPKNLSEFEDRIWAWYRADDIEPEDVEDGVLKEGKEILRWRDISGHGRHLYACRPDTPHSSAPPAGPTYSTSRMNGLPSLAFDGIAGLWTEGSQTSIVRSSQSKSLIPTGDGGATGGGVTAASFAMFIVFATDSQELGCLFHFSGNDFPGTFEKGLGKMILVNAAQGASHVNQIVDDPGKVFLRWEVDTSGTGSSGSGAYERPLEDDFLARAQDTGACILSLIDDGNAGNGPGGANTESLYRVNGRPIDRWWSKKMTGLKFNNSPVHPVCLGWYCLPVAHGSNWSPGSGLRFIPSHFIGHIREVLVLRRSNPRATTGDFAHVVDHDTGNVYGRIPFEGASWDGATTLTLTGAFAGYVFQAGDQIEITAGTGIATGPYTIASRIDSSNITLTATMGAATPTDVDGFIYSSLDGAGQSIDELTQIEGYIAHRSGLQHLLERETANAAETPHPFGLIDDFGATDAIASPPDADTGNPSDIGSIGLNFGMVTKYSSEGLFVWSYNYKTANDAVETASQRGGVGYAVVARRLDDETDVGVWCAGAQATTFTTPVGDTSVRRIIDKGDTFSIASVDGAWVANDQKYPSYFWPRMDVDKFGSLYYPWTADLNYTFKVFSKAGSAGVASELVTFLTSLSTTTALAIHHDPNIPDYGVGSAIRLAEHVTYISGTQATSKESLYRHNLVTVTARTGSARTISNLAIALPDIKTFTVSGVIATPTGGTGALDTNSEFAMIIPFNKTGDAVFVDGVSPYRVYRAREGDVEELVAETAGEIPKRAKLGCEWRSRLVLANFPDNPGGYAMSAMGNIRDWDFYPAVVSATSAVLGQLARAEDVPAIITALIPAREDLLIVGGYNSIWRMTGDPQDGGQLDKLSDEMGIAFGHSWAKDPDGRIFFFGLNPPGIYTLGADGSVVNVTKGTIEETEFDEIDFSSYNVMLAWNPIDRGIHITLQPRSAVTSAAERHWFWEEKSTDIARVAPIWTDTFGHEDVSPMVIRSLEGDDRGSRVVVVAGYDGKVRVWDPEALDDDGYGIDAYFDIVVARQTTRVEVMLTETRVTLAPDQDGARLELYANDVADRMGPVRHSADISPVKPTTFRKRVRGENIWIRLRNSLPGQRFAFESAWVDLTGAQIQRS